MTQPTRTGKTDRVVSAGGRLFHIGSVNSFYMMRVYERGEWYIAPAHNDNVTADRVRPGPLDCYFVFRDRIVWMQKSNCLHMKVYDAAARSWDSFDKFLPCVAYAHHLDMLSTVRIS